MLPSIVFNHPILYLFLGDTDSSLVDFLKDFYQKKNATEGLAFLHIKEQRDLSDELSALQIKFLKQTYPFPGYRRIYVVLNTHDTSVTYLKNVIFQVNNFFRNFNNIPLIDVFALLDESLVTNADIRKQIGQCLLKLKTLAQADENSKKLINMVYLLSNFNSQNMITDFSRLHQAMAMATLIKDCSSRDNPFKLYDERSFMARCTDPATGSQPGYFYSIGAKTIEKPMGLVKKMILREILSEEHKIQMEIQTPYFLSLDENILYQRVDSIFGYSSLENYDNVYGLMLDTKSLEAPYMTKAEAMEAFFHNRVDIYYDMNFKQGLLTNILEQADALAEELENMLVGCIQNSDIGFYKARALLSEFLSGPVSRIQSMIEKKNSEIHVQLKSWGTENFAVTRRNKIAGKVYDFPYTLAKEYLSIRNEEKRCQALLTIFEAARNRLTQHAEKMEERYKQLQAVVLDLEHQVENDLKKESILTAENFKQYYTGLTCSYIKEHYKSFFSRVYSLFYSHDTAAIQNLSQSYGEDMLTAPLFSESMYQEIYQRILSNENGEFHKRENVTDLLYKEMIDDKLYFLNLTGGERLCQDICFITKEKLLFQDEKLNKVNVFLDNTDGSLDIIYFIGAFTEENLANYNLYFAPDKEDVK